MKGEPGEKEDQGGAPTEQFPRGPAEHGTPPQVKGTPVDSFLIGDARVILEQEQEGRIGGRDAGSPDPVVIEIGEGVGGEEGGTDQRQLGVK